MDQKASQGLLRLGDDVLDERLMVPRGGETYEEKDLVKRLASTRKTNQQ